MITCYCDCSKRLYRINYTPVSDNQILQKFKPDVIYPRIANQSRLAYWLTCQSVSTITGSSIDPLPGPRT
jgi:hypothetical protein